MPLIRAAALELLRPVEINDLALNTTLYYAADLSYVALDIGLSSALFGVSPSRPRSGDSRVDSLPDDRYLNVARNRRGDIPHAWSHVSFTLCAHF